MIFCVRGMRIIDVTIYTDSILSLCGVCTQIEKEEGGEIVELWTTDNTHTHTHTMRTPSHSCSHGHRWLPLPGTDGGIGKQTTTLIARMYPPSTFGASIATLSSHGVSVRDHYP